jgi:indolepyruvate ferredoxin oxidoreductase beta subunit
MTTSILIAGVGGQGSLLTSRIIGSVTQLKGYSAKISEVHGMAQRGGSVITYVRFSDEKVHSPVIGRGEADYLLCFEELEAYRAIEYLKKGGKLFCNEQRLLPMPVILGTTKYPEGLLGKLKSRGVDVISADALALAAEAGSYKSVNVAMIGLMAKEMEKEMGIGADVWRESIRNTVKPQFVDINIKAFDKGFNQ